MACLKKTKHTQTIANQQPMTTKLLQIIGFEGDLPTKLSGDL